MGMKNDRCKMPSHWLAIEGSSGTPQTENPTTKQFYRVGRGSECGLSVRPVNGPSVESLRREA